MSLPLSNRVAISPDVLFRAVGDEAVLLNLKTELYLGLDPVGARMWTLFKESASLQQAFDLLLAEFDVDASRLRADLEEFLGQLKSQGLIELTEAAQA